MKIISFLGTANYSQTTYQWGEATYETRFFPAAVAHFIRPERLIVCATPTVQQHENLRQLTTHLQNMGVDCQIVSIPEGHSEADLWAIFDALTAVVQEGEKVAFDVTHSFRSLPILAFLAVAYLKVAKRVVVERVLYGAWEARDNTSNISPVFDLTPFVALLDWLTATNRFVETGDGHALAALLKTGIPPGEKMRDDLQARTLGRSLRSASETIESISLALRLTRPIETMQATAQLEATLKEAASGIPLRAKPFQVLVDQIAREYGQFALEEPANSATWADGLWRQLRMIRWYLDRRHVVQAATLAREWIVSVLALRFDSAMFDYERSRKVIEAALNNAVERRRTSPRPIDVNQFDELLEALPNADELIRLWNQLSELRNDIAHVGMKISPKPAALLKQKIDAMYPQLETVAHNLLPPTAVSIVS